MKKPVIRYTAGTLGKSLKITRVLVVPMAKGVWCLNIDFNQRCVFDYCGGPEGAHQIGFEHEATGALASVAFRFPVEMIPLIGEMSKRTYRCVAIADTIFAKGLKRLERERTNGSSFKTHSRRSRTIPSRN